jgi:CHAT domain-containing protein
VKTIKEIPGLSVEVIEEKQALEEFFQTGEADVVHFACHGAFQADNPARSVLQLGDRMLCPDDVIAENRNFGRVQPLVFLNACDSGRQGIGLTGLDG